MVDRKTLELNRRGWNEISANYQAGTYISTDDVHYGPLGLGERSLGLLGDVNLYNALAAMGTAMILGLDPGRIVEALASAPQTPGRLERVGTRGEYLVLVDYAHTPDALDRVLGVVRNLDPKRLISVFGCGGDRDRAKRPLMGRAGVQMSDLAIITSDNPRTEDPHAILDDILQGFKHSSDVKIIADRAEAIRWALAEARTGDCVLIAGKGHETHQVIQEERIPFSDCEVAADWLYHDQPVMTG